MISAKDLRDRFFMEKSRQSKFFKLYYKIVAGLETLNFCLEDDKQEERQFIESLTSFLFSGVRFKDGKFRLDLVPSVLDFPVRDGELEYLSKTKK